MPRNNPNAYKTTKSKTKRKKVPAGTLRKTQISQDKPFDLAKRLKKRMKEIS